jgi:hypothetical protein
MSLAIWDDNFLDNYFEENIKKNNIRRILKIYSKLN